MSFFDTSTSGSYSATPDGDYDVGSGYALAAPVAHEVGQQVVRQRRIIDPLYVEKIANAMNLKSDLRNHLHTFTEINEANEEPLTASQMKLELYKLAAVFQNTAEHRAFEEANPVSSLNSLVKEINIRLEDTWQVTATQRANMRILVQNYIADPTRLAFKSIHTDVINHVLANKEQLGYTNINKPSREKALERACKRVASSVRGALRLEIFNSIEGKKKVSLDKFSRDFAVKYKAIGDGFGDADRARNALLRGFAFDHPELRTIKEAEETEDKGDDDDDDDEAQVGEKRARTTKKGGRTPKSSDFFEQLDLYLSKKAEEFNSKKLMSDANWRILIDAAVQRDDRGFKDKENIQTYPGMRSDGGPSRQPSSSNRPRVQAMAAIPRTPGVPHVGHQSLNGLRFGGPQTPMASGSLGGTWDLPMPGAGSRSEGMAGLPPPSFRGIMNGPEPQFEQ